MARRNGPESAAGAGWRAVRPLLVRAAGPLRRSAGRRGSSMLRAPSSRRPGHGTSSIRHRRPSGRCAPRFCTPRHGTALIRPGRRPRHGMLSIGHLHRWPPMLFAPRSPASGPGTLPIRHRRWTGVRPSWRPAVRREAAMRPIVAPRIPRTPAVIVAPVRQEREGDDRHAEARPVGVQRNTLPAVGERQPPRIDPASAAVEFDVAPAPVAEATAHVHGCSRSQLRHQRVVPIGPGANVRGAGGDRILRARGGARGKQKRSEYRDKRASVHERSLRLRCRDRERCASSVPKPAGPGGSS